MLWGGDTKLLSKLPLHPDINSIAVAVKTNTLKNLLFMSYKIVSFNFD
jgi:hypothetical protein